MTPIEDDVTDSTPTAGLHATLHNELAAAVNAILDVRLPAVESRRVQNLGVDLPSRTKLNVEGMARAADNGSGLDSITLKVPLLVLHLDQVAADLALTLDTTGDLTQTTIDNNTAIVRSAIARANASGAEKVRIQCPPGVIALNPLHAITGSVTIRGASRDPAATILLFRGTMDATVLGGDCAIDLRDSTTGLEDLTVRGASGGTMPVATMDPYEQYGTGVRLFHGFINNCAVDGFCYAMDPRGDHIRIDNVTTSACWTPIYFGPNSGNAGDAKIRDVTGSAQNWCGFAIHPTYTINGVDCIIGHTISCPFGIWKMKQARRVADYNAGTVSIATGDAFLHGTGTLWRANVKNGATLRIGSTSYYVAHVWDDTTIELVRAWTAAPLVNVAYNLIDGLTLTPSVMSSSTFYGWSFEGVNCKIACEDNVGTMNDVKFINCNSSWWDVEQHPGAQASAGCMDAHIKGMASISDVEFHPQMVTATQAAQPNLCAVQATTVSNVDFGNIAPSLDSFRNLGRPWLKGITGPILSNAHGRYLGAPIKFGRARAQVLPYDLLADGGYASASSTGAFGQDVKPYATADADVRGTALGVGIDTTLDAVAYYASTRAGMRAAVCPSAVVSAAAAIGATTVTTLFTSRLGAAGSTFSIQNSAGVTIGTATVHANGTDLTITAPGLTAALAVGAVVYVPRGVAGAVVPINTPIVPRYGQAGGGTALTDVGQVMPAGATWTVLCGSSSNQADDSRQVRFVPQRAVRVPPLAPLVDGSVTPAKLSFDPATQTELDAVAAGGGLFGKGTDGAFDFDGVNTWASSIATLVGSTYTIKKPLFATTVRVRSGITLKCSMFPICATASITIDAGGVVDDSAPGDGGRGAGAVAGVGFYGAMVGTQGGTAAGTAGTAAGFGMAASGAGGLGPSGAGGAAGNAINTTSHILRIPDVVKTAIVGYGGVSRLITGGPAGGSGGGDGTNRGGGSGGGGGVIALFSPSVVNNGAITANGGNGGTPTVGNAGGGAGGSGGLILVYTLSAWTPGTTSVAGGTGGTAVGTGVNGGNGGAGAVLNVF